MSSIGPHRHQQKLWSEKPILLLATSPGGRGGATVLNAAATTFPHLGAQVVASFSLPSFFDNFDAEAGVTDSDLLGQLQEACDQLKEKL